MLKLKKYQERSLEILRKYLELARFEGGQKAYDKIQYERYNSSNYKPFQALAGLEDIPYICLRLPTGGGKTLLSAHSIALAGNAYIETEYPLTLWLVPTSIIKTQTLQTLQNPDHPNYQVLEKAFDGKFRVFDIADFRQIRPKDIEDSVCIVVSTFALLRVDKTDGRKAYDHDENLEPHFSKIPINVDEMEKGEDGKIKFSFVNLLNWHRPLVIVDEAHNAKTELSIDVLRRVNAACVIEYTATPAKNSNVIASVSAAELKAEQMIKLPIILSEHGSWEQAVTSAIQTRHKLQQAALKDKDYIRPIVLFQAENKNQDITVEVLENYLIEHEGIDRRQIAIATSDQKELDNIDLFNPNCEILYVITVQALKEGWDCSFAYVLCSVANTKSPVSVEQLLGRVLRMPYAAERTQADLNKAYAHVSSRSWPHAVSQLQDHLVNMGFEKQEVEECVHIQPFLFAQEETIKPFEVILTIEPDLLKLPDDARLLVKVHEVSSQIFELKAPKGLTQPLAKNLINCIGKEDRPEVTLKMKQYFGVRNLSPAASGECFVVPQLCLNFDDHLKLAEPEAYLDNRGWNLLDYPAILTKEEFTFDEQTKHYIVDIEGQKVISRFLHHSQQMSFKGFDHRITDNNLCFFLNKKLQAIDIKQEILLEFLRRVVKNLMMRGNLNIEKLWNAKSVLEKVLRAKIILYRKQAYTKAYQRCMFGQEAIVTVSLKDFSFSFDPNNYPANIYYNGSLRFNKHYYTNIAALNHEEEKCALAIDENPNVKYWVRNLSNQPKYAFWLPTSADRFYPDFVALLNDGRLLVIEYKGEHLDNEDTKEKELIGQVWAKESGNLFLIVWKEHEGKDIYAQIKAVTS